MRNSLLSFLILYSVLGFAYEDSDREAIQQRIKPVGNVRIETTATDVAEKAPLKETAAEETTMPAGKKTYQQFCGTCHKMGLAGAPKFRNKAEWKPRTDAKNLDQLTQSAIKGLNAMPPKGTCSSCSAEDIKAAIQYMLPQ